MSRFNFKRLIKRYAKIPVYELRETEGGRDPENGGVWIPGETEEILIENGALVPLSSNDLQYDEGGTYTSNDRKLYCYTQLKKGTKVRHKEKDYTVHNSMDYSDFDTDLSIYFVKRGDSN